MLNMKSPVINQIIAQNGGVMPNQQQPPNMNIGYNGYNGQYDGYSMNPNQNYAWVNGQPVGNPSPYAFPPPQNPYDNGYQQPNYGYAYNPALQMQQSGYMGYGYQNPQTSYGYQPTGMYNPYQPSYTNYYGNQAGYNYYNPALQQNIIQQQRKEEERRRREAIEYQKQLSRVAHAYFGEEMSDEELNRIYDPVDNRSQKEIAEAAEFERTAHIVQYGQYVGQEPTQNFTQLCNSNTQYHNKFINPDAGLVEFLEQAGNLYIDGLLREEKHKNRDLSGTYNHDGFKSVLNGQNPYAGKFSNNIEDDVVHLPESIKNRLTSTYAERRAQFMQSILSQQRRAT